MRLHYGKLSSSSRRVTMTAAILGIELEQHHVDLRDREAWLARVQALPAWAQTEPPPMG